MSSIRHAIMFSSGARYSTQLIGLVSTMIIARLLTPAEIGTFAVASAIVMLMTEFRMLGAGGYLIREPELTQGKIRSAIGLTILISWGFGIAILLLALPVSKLYELPPLATIFSILSISFFLAPYISIPTSLLARELNFKTQFKIRLIASLVGVASTTGFILLGFSYYSLAMGQTLLAITNFALLVFYRPSTMVWQPSFNNIGRVASFGIYTSFANFLRKTSVTIPDMVIGKMGSTTEVGIFSRGLGFIQFVSQTLMSGISPVALPYLARVRRQQSDIESAYTNASVLLGALVVPVLGVASLASLPAIRLFFGSQWDDAAPLASWLAIWAMLRCVHWFSNELLMANGLERILVVKEALSFGVLLPLIIVAYPYGLEWVAIAFVIAGLVEIAVSSVILSWSLNISAIKFFRKWLKNIWVTLACVIVTWSISLVIPFDTKQAWLPIVVIALVLPWVWLASLALTKHPLFEEVWSIIKRIIQSRVR